MGGGASLHHGGAANAAQFQRMCMSNARTLAAQGGDDTSIRPVKRALLSVSDKTGIVELAAFLRDQNVELLSTGMCAAVCSACSSPLDVCIPIN